MISLTKLFFVIYSLTLLQLSIGCNPVADPSMSNITTIYRKEIFHKAYEFPQRKPTFFQGRMLPYLFLVENKPMSFKLK